MHYKDGITEAQVGDLVKGTCYNTPGIIVGTLLGITEGSDTCNARVALAYVKGTAGNVMPFPPTPLSGQLSDPYVTHVILSDGLALVHREGCVYKDGITVAESTQFVGTKIDYAALKDLELVHRPQVGQ